MKTIYPFTLLFFALLAFHSCKDKEQKGGETLSAFPSGEYAKVVAYSYEDYQGGSIIKNGVLNPTVEREQELSAAQVEKLLKLVNTQEHYGDDVTRCFIPRLGFVFYDEQGKDLAQISICFQCNSHVSSPRIDAAYAEQHQGKTGYSKAGRKAFMDFCESLNIGPCSKTNSSEEEIEEN